MADDESTPARVVHCDWGGKASKRWLAAASRNGGNVQASAATPVGDTSSLLPRLRRGLRPGERLLIGFDFPIGLPRAYARAAGVRDFVSLLPDLGSGIWEHFYDKCQAPGEITLRRPFFPRSCRNKGDATRGHLVAGLDLDWDALFRECERATEQRGSACPLFWTLGGNQVGTAAISGWREVLVPALQEAALEVGIWPFHGDLAELLSTRRTILMETYPAEAYGHLGFPPRWKGKRSQARRRERSDDLLRWAARREVICEASLVEEIRDGFGSGSDGEDRFDAVVGLFGMLEVVLGHRSAGAPDHDSVRNIEGWIFGQQAPTGSSDGKPEL